MKTDVNIQKSFRREINLQTRSLKNKKAYTRKFKHKKETSHDRAFIVEGCVMRSQMWEKNAA